MPSSPPRDPSHGRLDRRRPRAARAPRRRRQQGPRALAGRGAAVRRSRELPRARTAGGRLRQPHPARQGDRGADRGGAGADRCRSTRTCASGTPTRRSRFYQPPEALDGSPRRQAFAEGRYEDFLPPHDVAGLQERMAAAVRKAAAPHPGRTVVAVSHGGAINALLAVVVGSPTELLLRPALHRGVAGPRDAGRTARPDLHQRGGPPRGRGPGCCLTPSRKDGIVIYTDSPGCVRCSEEEVMTDDRVAGRPAGAARHGVPRGHGAGGAGAAARARRHGTAHRPLPGEVDRPGRHDLARSRSPTTATTRCSRPSASCSSSRSRCRLAPQHRAPRAQLVQGDGGGRRAGAAHPRRGRHGARDAQHLPAPRLRAVRARPGQEPGASSASTTPGRTRWTASSHGLYGASTFGEVDMAARSLHQLPIEERHGIIFVCLTPGPRAGPRHVAR